MEITMDKKGHIIVRIVFAAVFLGILVVGGFALFQAGKSLGFQMGVTTSAITAGGDQPVNPALANPVYWRGPYFGLHPWFMGFPFFGLLCLCGLIPLTFLFFGMLFRPWRRMGYGAGHWHGHHHNWDSHPPSKNQEPGASQDSEKA
jgi:hypothetical protein